MVLVDQVGFPVSGHDLGPAGDVLHVGPDLINADSEEEIFFTSDGTESANLAIKGVAFANERKGKHLVISATEHPSVMNSVEFLEKQGWTATRVPVDPEGRIRVDQLTAALTDKTVLIAVPHVNHDIGTIQPIREIGRIAAEKGIPLYVDCEASAGWLPVDVQAMGANLVSFSPHRYYGPKGVGALYVRRKPRIRIEAQMHGGGHERGMRSGTLATHQIVGMGEAFRIAKEEMATENERIRMLRDRLYRGLNTMEEVYVNGDMEARVPHNLNISFNFVEGESLIMAIKDVAVSSGSACTSASLEPSYVLRALGRNDELAHSSIRFTVGRFTTEEEVDYVVELLKGKIGKLRELSPLWEMHKDGVDLNKVQWAAH